MTEHNRLVAVVIEVADLDRSAALYRDAFGIPLNPPDDHGGDDRWVSGQHCATSWTDGTFLHFALYEAKTADRTTSVQISFEVPDVDVAHATAVAAGAVVVHEPRPEQWGRSARYRDLDGNVIELSERA
jgi:predicted enzyme related to lactoylglutathione lyase